MPDISRVTAGYIALRDKKAEIKKRHTEELAPIVESMAQIEAWLLNDLQSRKVQSEKTQGGGTAYLSTLLKPKVEDGAIFLAFLKDNDLLHMLELRPSVSAVEEFLEAHQSPPPGLSIRRETFARVRK